MKADRYHCQGVRSGEREHQEFPGGDRWMMRRYFDCHHRCDGLGYDDCRRRTFCGVQFVYLVPKWRRRCGMQWYGE